MNYGELAYTEEWHAPTFEEHGDGTMKIVCPWCVGAGHSIMSKDARCGYCAGRGYVITEAEAS